MQNLIAEYLFTRKKCSLPAVGTLQIRASEATVAAGLKSISAPVPVISFTDQVGDVTELHNFIAAGKGISVDEAAYQLSKFCSELNSLQKGETYDLPEAGNFNKNGQGKLSFTPVSIPAYFLPDVHAERAIHEGNPHSILVGDRLTTNKEMKEFFSDDIPAKKSTWWIWAAILFVLVAAAMIFYLNDERRNSFFGNSNKPEIKQADSTYRKLP